MEIVLGSLYTSIRCPRAFELLHDLLLRFARGRRDERVWNGSVVFCVAPLYEGVQPVN